MTIEAGVQSEASSPPQKRVRFDLTTYVTLVPERSEYINAGIATAVWWTRSEQKDFVTDAKKELTGFMRENSVNDKEATRLLYQPSEIEIKPIGSPTSVVPNYEDYKQLIEAYTSAREVGKEHFHSGPSKDEAMPYHFASIAAAVAAGEDKELVECEVERCAGFIPVRGRERSCSTVEGLGILAADDSWTVLKQAPGCAGIL